MGKRGRERLEGVLLVRFRGSLRGVYEEEIGQETLVGWCKDKIC